MNKNGLKKVFANYNAKLAKANSEKETKRIQLHQTALFYKVESDYGRRIAEGLRLAAKELEILVNLAPSEKSSADEFQPFPRLSRRVDAFARLRESNLLELLEQ